MFRISALVGDMNPGQRQLFQVARRIVQKYDRQRARRIQRLAYRREQLLIENTRLAKKMKKLRRQIERMRILVRTHKESGCSFATLEEMVRYYSFSFRKFSSSFQYFCRHLNFCAVPTAK